MNSRSRTRFIAIVATLSLASTAIAVSTVANAAPGENVAELPVSVDSPSTETAVITGVGVDFSFNQVPVDGYVDVAVDRDGASRLAPLPDGLGTVRLLSATLRDMDGVIQDGSAVEGLVCVDVSLLTISRGSPAVYAFDETTTTWLGDAFAGDEASGFCTDFSGSTVTFVVAAPLLEVDVDTIDFAITRMDGPMPIFEGAFGDDPAYGKHLVIEVTNTSDQPVTIGLGVDLLAEGVDEKMWRPTTFGYDDSDEGSGLEEFFTLAVPAGSTVTAEAPDWPGKTYTFWAVDAENVGLSVPLSSYHTGGEFLRLVFDLANSVVELGNVAQFAGERIFPGVTTTIEAQGLTPGESYELWLTPGLDYFTFLFLGADLADGSIQVGTASVDPTGTLAATFSVPANVTVGSGYQLMIGDPGSRSWPAGTIDAITIVAPEFGGTVSGPTAIDPVVNVPVGTASVTFTFPAGSAEGATTVSGSSTGPAAVGFTLAGIYYHLSTTSTFNGSVEVCISVADGIDPSGLRLYHYVLVDSTYQWVDITTRYEPTAVCGETDSFSPFALGIPDVPVVDDVVLTNKNQCKKGGWATSTLPVFTNQGDCVSHFATQKAKGKRK